MITPKFVETISALPSVPALIASIRSARDSVGTSITVGPVLMSPGMSSVTVVPGVSVGLITLPTIEAGALVTL